MKPIEFPGHNIVFGKDQPEYLPLPALAVGDDAGTVITCWELTDEEIAAIVKNRKIFLQQLTFKAALQPILPLADLSDGFQLIYPT